MAPPLRAEAVAARKGTYAKGGGWTHVVLDTHADYSVSDVNLYGAPGTERTFKLTVRNNGPADAGATEQLVFSPAPGMTMIKQPMSEIDEDVHEPFCTHRGATYTCDLDALKPGRSQDLTFTMLLGAPGAGTLTLRDKAPVAGWYAGDRDPDPANDEAVIRVHPER